MGDESNGSKRRARRSYLLLYIGIVLLVTPLIYAPLVNAEVFAKLHRFMVIINAVGGGLVAGYLTGKIFSEAAGVKAAGGVAFSLVLLYFDPASQINLDVQQQRNQQITAANENPPPSAPLECKRVESIAVLGWTENSKTKYCQERGWDGVTNFPGGVYRSNGGGFCYEGSAEACLNLVLRRIREG